MDVFPLSADFVPDASFLLGSRDKVAFAVESLGHADVGDAGGIAMQMHDRTRNRRRDILACRVAGQVEVVLMKRHPLNKVAFSFGFEGGDIFRTKSRVRFPIGCDDGLDQLVSQIDDVLSGVTHVGKVSYGRRLVNVTAWSYADEFVLFAAPQTRAVRDRADSCERAPGFACQ